jgi:hypothetical protein
MALVDRGVLRGAVGLARGRVHDTPHVPAPRRLEHVERSRDVGRDVALRGDVRVRDADERRQVEDGVAAGNGARDAERILDLAGDYLEGPADLGVQFPQVP